MARSPTQIMRDFIDSEAAGGLVLMASAALALVAANSPLAAAYFDLLEHHVFGLSILYWVNDALMALFFLLVGLEIKRELLVGQLASWRDRALPGLAAVGGMIVPAVDVSSSMWRRRRRCGDGRSRRPPISPFRPAFSRCSAHACRCR